MPRYGTMGRKTSPKYAFFMRFGLNGGAFMSSNPRLPAQVPPSMFRPTPMPRLLKSFMLAAALCAAPTMLGVAQAAGPINVEKVAVVDLQRCIMETKQGQAATKELEKSLTRGRAKLERAQKELQKQASDLQAKAAMLSPQEGQRREQELMRKQQELQQLYEEQSVKLQEKEAQLTEKIYRNVAKVVKKLATDEGVQLVLVRTPATVIYANPKIDVTNKVIVAYDKQFK